MKIEFGRSNQSTVGVEWEMAVIDATTFEQVPGAIHVLERVDDPENGPIRGEFLDSMLELVTGVHRKVSDAEAELQHHLERVLDWLEPHGLTVLPAGTHPFGDPTIQHHRAKAKYNRVADRNAWWGRQMTINGVHVHVGVDDADKAMEIVQGLARLSCYFIALSGSSPFWRAEDTEFASQRTMLFQQLATNGPPYKVLDWNSYVEHIHQLIDYGMIDAPSELRWDVRPSAWGTVENRLMDSVPTVWELGALTALSQCVAERYSRAIEVGEPIWRLPHWMMRENKWRAARYGMDATVMTPRPEQRTTSTRQGLAYWLRQVEPIAEEFGCSEQLSRVPQLADGGPSYARQRRVWNTTGDMRAVAASINAETQAGRPNFEENVR